MAGWVRLHRCIMDKAIWKNHNLYRVFSWCIMKATWQPYETIVGMTKVVLEPGQFIFGRYEAAAELLMKPSTVFDCMKWLKANSTIDIKSDNKKSVITIINWPFYQSGEDEPDTKSDNSSDNNATTSRQQADTNKKIKNNKEVKEDTYDYFADFWSKYPKKKARGDAGKAWKKIKPTEYDALFAGLQLAMQSKEWQRENGQFIPYPATWLNGRRWEDETEAPLSVSVNTITKAQADAMDGFAYLEFVNNGGKVQG